MFVEVFEIPENTLVLSSDSTLLIASMTLFVVTIYLMYETIFLNSFFSESIGYIYIK